MPRKSKEELLKDTTTTIPDANKKVEKKSTIKKAPSEVTPKKKVVKKEKSTTSTVKKSTKEIKTADEKAMKATKKTTAKKDTAKKQPTKKKTTTKKETTKTTTTKKNTSKTTTRKKKESSTTHAKPVIEVMEYYDLPYRYNQTVVKVLAQTPTTLFIYWDISDTDREHYQELYGDAFFSTTKPVLIIHNETMQYAFEIEINDFANSWYLHVNDSNCKYHVELGRKPITHEVSIPNDYLYVTSSNAIEAPNDHILIDVNTKTVYFKDIKTNVITSKDVSSLAFMRNMGKLYDIYEKFYQEELEKEKNWQLDLQNPSSSNPTSTFK